MHSSSSIFGLGYTFEAYTVDQMIDILRVMLTSKGELLSNMDGTTPQSPQSGQSPSYPPETIEAIARLLRQFDPEQLATQNAGLVSNWLSFAQIERDDRLDLDEARQQPLLACTLSYDDFAQASAKVREMTTKS